MEANIILDIAVVAVFVLNAVIGLKKGLMKMFFSVASYVVAGAVVLMFSAPFNAFMMQTEMPQLVRLQISPIVENAIDNASGSRITIDDALTKVGMPEFVITYIEKNTDMNKLADNFASALIDSAVNGTVKIISEILLFVGVYIILFLIALAIGGLLKNRILGGFNKMLGASVGVLNAMIIVYLLCGAVMLLAPVTDLSRITDLIQQTFITKCFYNNNVLMNLFF